MAFDYPVALDLKGQLCLLAGDGPLAVDRLTELLRARADAVVVTPSPSKGLAAQCSAFNVTVVPRLLEPDDLDGAALCIVTGEDDADAPALHAAARDHGVLFAALGDVAHCDFDALSQVHRGPVTVTISSSGRAPALSERLRRHLERTLDPELAALAEVVAAVDQEHAPREIPFGEWADRWQGALADLDVLLEQLRAGDRDAVHAHLLGTIRGEDG